MIRELKITEAKNRSIIDDTSRVLRVAAYCRVSTSSDDQKNSIETQRKFFNRIMQSHPNWQLVEIFADKGISGTSLEKRDEFNRMISLALNGKIDLIVTKEVSRFSRNTQDLLNIVSELRKRNIYVWFKTNNIITDSFDFLQKLTETSTAAQGESLLTSGRVRVGQAEQMAAGVVFGRREMYGYKIHRDPETDKQWFEIIEDEAKVIKKIFHWFAEGDGTYVIARRLENEGVKPKRYAHGFSAAVILRILRNEKYVGDLEQGKTYTPDPLTHKKKYNNNKQSNRYYITDHHPEEAIIDRDTWNKVQNILAEKAPSDEIKAKHSNRYWTSGKIYCGICGGRYVSLQKKQKNGRYKAWVCFENHQRGVKKDVEIAGETVTVGCDGKRVNDKVLRIAIYDIITNYLVPYKEIILKEILSDINGRKKPVNNKSKIQNLNKKLDKLENETIVSLTDKYVAGKINDSIYEKMSQKYQDDINKLKEEISALEEADSTANSNIIVFNNYKAQIEKIINLKDEDINEELFGRVTKKIIVYPDNVLEFYLSFLPNPIKMKYSTTGKTEKFDAIFEILTDE